jgi:hypothetical protein
MCVTGYSEHLKNANLIVEARSHSEGIYGGPRKEKGKCNQRREGCWGFFHSTPIVYQESITAFSNVTGNTNVAHHAKYSK